MTAEEFHKQWRSAGQLTDHITCYAACVFAEAYAEHVVSSKAAEATPSCICATNCHFDCEDKLCKCPHHLTATEAPGGQGVSGMSEDMKAHRRKAFAPDEVEAIEKEHEHSWLKKQAELEDNANCCIGCPPTEADFKALAAPADDGMYEACAKVRELHTRSLSSGTGKIIICMCSICETFKAWQKSNHLTAAEAPGGQDELRQMLVKFRDILRKKRFGLTPEGADEAADRVDGFIEKIDELAAPAALSERADATIEDEIFVEACDLVTYCKEHKKPAGYLAAEVARLIRRHTRAGLSSQEGK